MTSSTLDTGAAGALPPRGRSADDPARPAVGRADGRPGARRRTRRRLEGGAVTLGSVLAALVWISPLILLVISALRPLSDFLSNGPVSWPQELTLANFPEAWEAGQFGTAYLNSAILLLVKVPLGVLVASLLAYALAKLEFPFRNVILFTVVLGMTIPIYIAIVPLFTMLRGVGMTDSIAGIIPPYIAFGLPLQVLILQAFFRRVPEELLDWRREEPESSWGGGSWGSGGGGGGGAGAADRADRALDRRATFRDGDVRHGARGPRDADGDLRGDAERAVLRSDVRARGLPLHGADRAGARPVRERAAGFDVPVGQ